MTRCNGVQSLGRWGWFAMDSVVSIHSPCIDNILRISIYFLDFGFRITLHFAGGGVDFRAVFDFNGPPKTDEPRLQSSPALLSALKGLPYFVTEKIDGTSGTFGFWNGELKVGKL
jgi:hypothetical protein